MMYVVLAAVIVLGLRPPCLVERDRAEHNYREDVSRLVPRHLLRSQPDAELMADGAVGVPAAHADRLGCCSRSGRSPGWCTCSARRSATCSGRTSCTGAGDAQGAGPRDPAGASDDRCGASPSAGATGPSPRPGRARAPRAGPAPAAARRRRARAGRRRRRGAPCWWRTRAGTTWRPRPRGGSAPRSEVALLVLIDDGHVPDLLRPVRAVSMLRATTHTGAATRAGATHQERVDVGHVHSCGRSGMTRPRPLLGILRH